MALNLSLSDISIYIIYICIYLRLEQGYRFLEENHRRKVSFLWHDIEGTFCQCNLSVMLLNTWLWYCLPDFYTVKLLFSFLSFLYSLEEATVCLALPLMVRGTVYLLESKVLHKLLEFFSMGALSSLSHLLIYSITYFLPVWTYAIWVSSATSNLHQVEVKEEQNKHEAEKGTQSQKASCSFILRLI